MKDINSKAILNNGVNMPWLGFGTYKVENGYSVIESVKEALKVGYRHIDTASFYDNETGVGTAIKESRVSSLPCSKGIKRVLQRAKYSVRSLVTFDER